MAVLAQAIMRGLLAARPAATVNTAGRLYFATDTGVVYRAANDGSGWETFATYGATGGAFETFGVVFTSSGDVALKGDGTIATKRYEL
jgi:hypothetical protein